MQGLRPAPGDEYPGWGPANYHDVFFSGVTSKSNIFLDFSFDSFSSYLSSYVSTSQYMKWKARDAGYFKLLLSEIIVCLCRTIQNKLIYFSAIIGAPEKVKIAITFSVKNIFWRSCKFYKRTVRGAQNISLFLTFYIDVIGRTKMSK